MFDESASASYVPKNTFAHVNTSARTTAGDSFSTQVESGVCDIQYIFYDNIVSVVVIM